ncbi:hypothetical protein SK128_020366 [Halocaridina rubra]|uniref:Uncharacterized protein n=1 Tax=Halocaridina rubra TaxID=373956 RepID=A0AAN8WWS5_HALRR
MIGGDGIGIEILNGSRRGDRTGGDLGEWNRDWNIKWVDMGTLDRDLEELDGGWRDWTGSGVGDWTGGGGGDWIGGSGRDWIGVGGEYWTGEVFSPDIGLEKFLKTASPFVMDFLAPSAMILLVLA